MASLRRKAALLCVWVLCRRLVLRRNEEVPAQGQQELTDASSELGKREYFSV